MIANREIYTHMLEKKDMSSWSCPNCKAGFLQLMEESLQLKEEATNSSNPYEIFFRYAAFLECTNGNCNEIVSSIGEFSPEVYQDYDEYGEVVNIQKEWFFPKYFYPPLHIFRTPGNTPEKVKEYIRKSFSSFFSDSESSANSLRVALECIINELNENPKLRILHKKIEGLASPKYDKIRDKCMAIKWLGNDGSHCGDIKMTGNDILDGYDVLSFILDELYIEESNHVNEITKRLNENKGI